MKTCARRVSTIRIVARPENASCAKALRVLAGLELLGKERHEGGVERPFGKEAAEHVGQREGHEEGLGHRARAHERRDQDVAKEAENAAHQGPESRP